MSHIVRDRSPGVLMDEPAIAVRMLDTLAHRIADLDRGSTA
jgi:hypothetical protein